MNRNKEVVIGLTIGMVCVSSLAQGTLNFANSAAGWQAKVYDTDGVTPLTGTNFSAQLCWVAAVGVTDSTVLAPLNPPVTFSSVPSEAGLFFGGPRTIPVAPGTTITAQIRVWENICGPSWSSAMDVFGARIGESKLFLVTLADPTGLPATMTNLQPFDVAIVQPILDTWGVVLQDFGVRTNELGFNMVANTQRILIVEAATNLLNPIWSPLKTNFYNQNFQPLYFNDPEWTNYPIRFYRTRTPH